MRPERTTDAAGECFRGDSPPAGDIPSILLVDDDPAVRASLQFTLELEGIEVAAFDSAEAAAQQTGIEGYSCLVIDYWLPRLDGLALLATLRASGVQAPAIIITSNPTRKLRQAVSEIGATLIEKPLLCDELMATVREMLAHP